MLGEKRTKETVKNSATLKMVAAVLLALLACPFNVFSNSPVKPHRPVRRATSPLAPAWPDTINVEGETFQAVGDTILWGAPESAAIATPVAPEARTYNFNPDPSRAVWLSALFPGLGQLYNRRYWKLPIIIGGYMGLGYATQWNNTMLRDYSRAYADAMDSDPSSNSYMDFFPPNTNESDINFTWLQNVMKSRKDFYRRNRDLCIICMVGVYLLAMVDAYVDASLSHFDISPNLSMDVAPTLIQDRSCSRPGVGMLWALNF